MNVLKYQQCHVCKNIIAQILNTEYLISSLEGLRLEETIWDKILHFQVAEIVAIAGNVYLKQANIPRHKAKSRSETGRNSSNQKTVGLRM